MSRSEDTTGSSDSTAARRELLAIAAEMAASQAHLRAVLALLAGDGGAEPRWEPVRDPETGQRLFDWNAALGKMRFVTKWHGERREVILPMPQVA